jgi:hypothetical protein
MANSTGPRGAFGLEFSEQVEFFRKKINLPTERWNDIWQDAHDRAFVVAGAKKADLLADLNAAVAKAIEKGTGLEEFRKDFRKIVEERGWHGWTGEGSKVGEAWRTRVIWETNLATSRAAGRYAQLTSPDLLARRPFWKYIHNDGVLNPRPQHVAWNGMVLRHDHPFWKTNFPPNGWGCKCRVTAVRAPAEGDKTTPPDGWDKPDAKGNLPGIDKGWAYTPGASASDDLRKIVAQKAANLPPELARDFLAQAEKVGVTPDAPVLVAQKSAKTEGDAKKWLLDKAGKNTERAVIYDVATGKEISRVVSKERDIIPLTEEISDLLSDRKSSLALLHSHPDSLSLSPQDLTLLARPGAARIVAYGHDKSWFAAERGANSARLIKVMESADEELSRQLVELVRRGLNPDGLEAHLRNLALDRAGIVRYEYALDP